MEVVCWNINMMYLMACSWLFCATYRLSTVVGHSTAVRLSCVRSVDGANYTQRSHLANWSPYVSHFTGALLSFLCRLWIFWCWTVWFSTLVLNWGLLSVERRDLRTCQLPTAYLCYCIEIMAMPQIVCLSSHLSGLMEGLFFVGRSGLI